MAHIASILIGGLAVYYLSLLVTEQDGPYKIFHKLRVLVGAIPEYLIETEDGLEWTREHVETHEGRRYIPTNQISEVFTCHICFAIYGAVLVTLLSLILPQLVAVLAVAGGSVIARK